MLTARSRLCLEDRRAAVALEFAMVAPMLILVMVCTYDFTQLLLTQQRMAAAANAIAKIVTNIAAQPNGTNIITGDQTELAGTAVFAYLPEWQGIDQSRYSVTISSIVMIPTVPGCASGCTYVATVKWSASLAYGAVAHRACGSLAASPPAALDFMALPSGVFGDQPLVVVDIAYQYRPMFIGYLLTALNLSKSAMTPPRIGGLTQPVQYTPSGDIGASLYATCF